MSAFASIGGLQGIGSILGGIGALGGAFGGSDGIKGSDLRKMQRVQLDFTEQYPWRVVRGARRAGLHPLFVMGNTPSMNMSGSIGGTTGGGGVGDALRGIGRAVEGVGEARQALVREKEQHAASVSESRARAEMYRSEAARNWAAQPESFVDATVANSFGKRGQVTNNAKRTDEGVNPKHALSDLPKKLPKPGGGYIDTSKFSPAEWASFWLGEPGEWEYAARNYGIRAGDAVKRQKARELNWYFRFMKRFFE